MTDFDDSTGIMRARKKVRMGSAKVVASLLTSVTLIGSTILGVSWKFVGQIAQAVTPLQLESEIPPLSAPILNARRNPETLSHDIRFRPLTTQLQTLSNRLPANSCLAVDIEGSRIASVNPDTSLMPASNMKIVVAAVALEVLTPDYVFSTKLLGNVSGNSTTGDVYLVGGGDPVLVSGEYPTTEPYPTFNFTRVEQLIDALSAKGIASINGSIVGDESRYDNERYTPSLGLGIKGTEVGPLGSLIINDGIVTGNPIKPDNPALGAAMELTTMLTDRGVQVNGSPKTGVAPSDVEVLVQVDSLPLRDIIAEMLTNSDNNTADLLVKEIGFATNGIGSRLSGLEAIKAQLVEWGIPLDALNFVDGSGLDRDNRLTCSSLIALLNRDAGFGPIGLGLATAGQTGTLRDVLGDTLGAGKLRGKTGTLTGAKALSGFVPYSEDKASIFTLILNSPNASNQTTYRPLWNELSNILGGFSESPTAQELAPN